MIRGQASLGTPCGWAVRSSLAVTTPPLRNGSGSAPSEELQTSVLNPEPTKPFLQIPFCGSLMYFPLRSILPYTPLQNLFIQQIPVEYLICDRYR